MCFVFNYASNRHKTQSADGRLREELDAPWGATLRFGTGVRKGTMRYQQMPEPARLRHLHPFASRLHLCFFTRTIEINGNKKIRRWGVHRSTLSSGYHRVSGWPTAEDHVSSCRLQEAVSGIGLRASSSRELQIHRGRQYRASAAPRDAATTTISEPDVSARKRAASCVRSA